MIAVMMGAPGAGKGTQAELLARTYGWKKFSTGEALRRQVKLGTALGKEVEGILKTGKLVSDGTLFEVVTKELANHAEGEVVLLDGYPRTLGQAKMLQTLRQDHPVVAAMYIKVKRQTLISRLGGREVCEDCGAVYHSVSRPPAKEGLCDCCGKPLSRRRDDEAQQIDTRLKVFADETEPVMGYYDALGLSEYIDGEDSSEAVFKRVRDRIEKCVPTLATKI